MILTVFLALLTCKNNAGKLKISTIYTEPKRVIKEIPETNKTHTYNTREEIGERLNPMILMLFKNDETFAFRLQGNISSGGHRINQIRKIRFEKGEQNGNAITLRYYTEIKKTSGKESADIAGYNYTQDETYTIPDGVKILKIELYEDRVNNSLHTRHKVIAQQTFTFFAQI